MALKLTILYDSEAAAGLCAGNGFSCLIEANGKTMLFDTGWDGDRLISNMEKLGIRAGDIGAAFISHAHWDHMGGLARFLHVRGRIPVYAPSSFSENLKKEMGGLAEVVEIREGREICGGFCTTGELGVNPKEQSLIVQREGGNVVVCGCAHPGVDAILEKAREFGEIHGIIGGFHDFGNLDALRGLRLLVPCHCTSKKDEIRRMYPKTCMDGGAGSVFEL
jgi:7,8-dihydropterin-6-yl-methyl-4-(beta-D-ribofuranosyl)aminobenzene 5'-phosphate synthase